MTITRASRVFCLVHRARHAVSTPRARRRRARYNYPLGKKTFAPLGTLIFSVVMFTACFQVLQEAAMTLVALDDHELAFGWIEVRRLRNMAHVRTERTASVTCRTRAPLDQVSRDMVRRSKDMARRICTGVLTERTTSVACHE